jgi:hypothetical protein
MGRLDCGAGGQQRDQRGWRGSRAGDGAWSPLNLGSILFTYSSLAGVIRQPLLQPRGGPAWRALSAPNRLSGTDWIVGNGGHGPASRLYATFLA